MNKNIRKIFPAILLVAAGLVFSDTFAETVEYDFEIIIFEDTSGRYANSEQWQHELPQAITDQNSNQDGARRNMGTGAAMDELSNITSIKGIGLNRYARTLKANKRYNVLVHKAWRQGGFADDAAINIPIDSRNERINAGMQTSQSASANTIHGSIRIELGRYLHIYTDMVYQQPRANVMPVIPGEEPQLYQNYPIKFHRRMRSKELHYLDHPMVGILVMAKPVEKQNESKETG